MKYFLTYFTFLATFTLSFASYSQTEIKGTVTGNDGLPLPGVSILIKGTLTGTTTDYDGNYTIRASAGNVLEFSYLGFQPKEVTVGQSTEINVTMTEDVAQLDEVVVVGYGTQKKSDVTGSVASFDTERLQKLPQTNIEQALQGTLPGVNITVNSNTASGASNTLNIRGTRSINGGSNPLIVLDGIIFSGSLSEINLNDIQSIEVLKDASSAAIYGSRGANGVIIITTKKGKKGKLRLSVNSYYGTDMPNELPDMMNAETFYQRRIERFGIDDITDSEAEVYASGEFVDWVDLILRNGSRSEHNISLSGGGDKINYFVSGNFQEIEGVAVNDKFSKSNFRVNLELKPLDWLSIGTNTLLGFRDADGNAGDFEEAFWINPLTRAFNPDGSLTEFPWPEEVFYRNALEPTKYLNNNDAHSIVSNNYVKIDLPVKGLSYRLNTGFTKRGTLQQTYRGVDTRRGREVGGYANQQTTTSEDWLIENIINYERSFGKHNLFLTGLYSSQQEQSEALSLTGEGFPNDARTFYQFNNADVLTASPNYTKITRVSQMLRINYNYDSKYLLTLTARRDASSPFGSDQKYGFFPSVALGWNLHKENFLKDNPAISNLKLRLSLGQNGNDGIQAYSLLARLTPRSYTDGENSLFGFFPNRLANDTVGWETTTAYNYGLDFSLFKSRIQGSIDYFTSTTQDLLLDQAIPAINGATVLRKNIGETKGRGFELAMTTHNISKKDFDWNTQFAFTKSSNEIVDLGLRDENGNPIDDVGSRWFLGEEVSVNYGYVYDGVWQLDEVDGVNLSDYGVSQAGDVKYKDINDDGVIDENDRTIIGSRQPDFTLGLTNNFRYKNFSLNVFFNWVQGVTKNNTLISTNDFRLQRRVYNVNYWSPDNPTNDFPENADRTTNPFGAQFYEDASFIRLRDVTLNYAMPQKVLDALSMSNFDIFVNAKNLWTITDWKGIDPEVSNQRDRPFSTTLILGLRFGI